jgi:hypothetical protein
MANQFPYLKSASEPLGVVEQIAAALTMHPDEDPEFRNAEYTWFGRMLAADGFVWSYSNGEEGEVVKVEGRPAFANYYYNQTLSYTLYDHTSLSLTPLPLDSNLAVVQGKVTIKGKYNNDEHKGDHYFRYLIKKEADKWRVQKWFLYKLGDGRSALDIIFETDVNEEPCLA